MASTTAATVSNPTQAPASSQSPTSSSAFLPTAPPDGFARPGSPRKRRRSIDTPQSPAKNLEGQVREKLEITSPNAPKAPVELTVAAEMAEQKRRKLGHNTETLQPAGAGNKQSTNPQVQALSALRGDQSKATSKPGDAPPAVTALPRPLEPPSVVVPEGNVPISTQTSPTSNASLNTTSSAGLNGPQVASPIDMTENETGADGDVPMASGSLTVHTPSSKAHSYPEPNLHATQATTPARRDMSFPGGSSTPSEDTKASGGGKKHKCTYCDTEFTRHHNLKSHLLTHSHEKPYLCQQCDMRFRRLHDLKRHTKLHTGERPHVCPICNRKFARGDALARHTKGAGGCAGHRSSIGSYSNEVPNDGELVMNNLMYAGEASQEPVEMDESEDSSRQPRDPQRQNSLQNSQYRQTPLTYPLPSSSQRSYLQAPGAHAGAAPAATSPPSSHAGYAAPGHQASYPSTNAFAHGGMTESPVPISPSTNHHASSHDHARRGSAGHQPPGHFARQGGQGRASPQSGAVGSAPIANMGLPPPQSLTPSAPAGSANSHFAQLPPPLPSISTDGRPAAGPGAGAVPHGHSYTSGPGSASTHNSLSSHGQSSGERGALGIDDRDRLWAMVRAQETEMAQMRKAFDAEMGQMRERQEILEREIKSLRRANGEKQSTV